MGDTLVQYFLVHRSTFEVIDVAPTLDDARDANTELQSMARRTGGHVPVAIVASKRLDIAVKMVRDREIEMSYNPPVYL